MRHSISSCKSIVRRGAALGGFITPFVLCYLLMVEVAGFAVTPETGGEASPTAVEDSRTLQPIPNPSNQFPIGPLRYHIDEDPAIGEHTTILYGDLQTLITQKDRQAEAMEQVGYEDITATSYNILGEANWARIFAALYRAGYDGDVAIEHEDRDFEKTDELIKRGFLIARDVLRPYIK